MAKKPKKGAELPEPAAAPPKTPGLTLAEHPKARRQIRAAKGWGGLIFFALAFVLSLRTGLAFPDAALRAIEIGLAGYLISWFVAVVVWRQLANAEVETARRALEQRIAAALEKQKQAEEAAAS